MNSTTPGMLSPRANLQASAHKKRSRAASHEGRQFNGSLAPPRPPLSGEMFLQVSTHKSLRRKGVSPDQFGDNERMIELGKTVFDLVLTLHLLRKRPMLKVKDLAVRRAWAQTLCVKLTKL
jgi:dsRNA-specific ribonuclease